MKRKKAVYAALPIVAAAGIAYMTAFALPKSALFEDPAPEIATVSADADSLTFVNFFELVNAGYEGFYMSSGYRDFEEQSALYEEAANKSFVQPAGFSEHQTGLAADISILNGDSGKSGRRWLIENAHRYGFILRYPEDKTDITGIAYEPWHFRYVGEEIAEYVYRHGLCYEEYLELLREKGECYYKGSLVMYATANGGRIEVPSGAEYVIGSDNAGGYIIVTRM